MSASPNIASWGRQPSSHPVVDSASHPQPPAPSQPPRPLLCPRSSQPPGLLAPATQRLLHFARRATTQPSQSPALCAAVATNVQFACLPTLPILPFHTLHTCCAPFKRSQRKRFKPTNQLNLSFLQNGATLCQLVELLNRHVNP